MRAALLPKRGVKVGSHLLYYLNIQLDKTKSSAGNVDLPCLGVFEMENGKIRLWRDYFDMNTYISAMS